MVTLAKYNIAFYYLTLVYGSQLLIVYESVIRNKYTCIVLPYSGKFSLGSYFRDFADCKRSRENKNRNNLFQQKFKGRFI